jgi:hypothetical protein
MAFNPVLLAAMSGVKPSESGLASGIVNTSFMMGGALGLAILASLAASRTATLLDSGQSSLLVGAVFAVAAAVVGATFLREPAGAMQHDAEHMHGPEPAAAID